MSRLFVLLALVGGLVAACLPPEGHVGGGPDPCIYGRPNPEWIHAHNGQVPDCP